MNLHVEQVWVSIGPDELEDLKGITPELDEVLKNAENIADSFYKLDLETDIVQKLLGSLEVANQEEIGFYSLLSNAEDVFSA